MNRPSMLAVVRFAVVAGSLLIASCADRPLPFPGPDMAVPSGEVVRACATMTSCGLASRLGAVGSFGSSVASCVSACNGIERRDIQYSTHLDSATVACLAGAGSDCTRATACLNGGMAPSACKVGISVCDGNVQRDCNDGSTTSFDCASIGLGCVVADPLARRGACGYATCAKEYETQCVGDVVATCVVTAGGMRVLVPQTDCAAIGGACAQVDTAPACRGKGDVCATGSAPTCQNNFAVSCLAGRTAILDCTGIRQRCDGGKCVPFDSCNAAPACAGTVLTVCGPAGSESVDCAGLGFAGCDPGNGGRCTGAAR